MNKIFKYLIFFILSLSFIIFSNIYFVNADSITCVASQICSDDAFSDGQHACFYASGVSGYTCNCDSGTAICIGSGTEACGPNTCDLGEGCSCDPGITPTDCVYGGWGDWGTCSASCGGGTQTRSRTCGPLDPPCTTSTECSIGTTQSDSQSCNTCSCSEGQSCGCGGTVQCDGSCSAPSPGPCGCSPPPNNYGQPCGSCGGAINCAGACSIATPVNYGQSCGSCGGIIQCNGLCSISTPVNLGQPCGTCGRGTQTCSGCSGDFTNCGTLGVAEWFDVGSCGNCGTLQFFCNGCDWTANQRCVNQGACYPGQIINGASCGLGNCGTMQSVCQSNCQAGSSSCTGTNPNFGQPCGSCGGTVKCDNTCTIPTPANLGQPCGSCGGAINCAGACSIATPVNYGQSCGSCGGTIKCDSTCSIATPVNYNQPCNRNGCGGTGTIKCDGSCSTLPPVCPCDPLPTPANLGQSCGSCGGAIQCNTTCSISTPINYGQVCGPGGTIQCDSTCNGPCSPNPSPANYNQPCGSCGGTISCAGTCSISTPINYGQICGPSGAIQCDSTCNGPCSPNPAPANYNQSCSICGLTDCAGNCTSQTTQVTRNCRQLTKQQFKDIYSLDDDELSQLASNTSQFQNLINSATGQDPRKIIHDKCFKDHDQASCLIMSKKITTTVFGNNNFYSCFNKPGDTACCQNASSCVWNFVCYPDGHKEDFDGDGIAERCLAHSPGQWVPDFETDCTNGIDDDLDGLTDCADPDCAGTVNGTVFDQNSQPIALADINVKQDLTTVSSATTAQDGTYAVGVNCGTYNVVASDPKHAPQIKTNIPVPPRGQVFLNFSLLLGTSCQPDCTYVSDNLVHAGCGGINGCSFYDSVAKAACDLSQPGWIRDYNSSHYITCASGSPKAKLQLQASLSCSSGTIVKITRIVTYNGKPVKLIVAACG